MPKLSIVTTFFINEGTCSSEEAHTWSLTCINWNSGWNNEKSKQTGLISCEDPWDLETLNIVIIIKRHDVYNNMAWTRSPPDSVLVVYTNRHQASLKSLSWKHMHTWLCLWVWLKVASLSTASIPFWTAPLPNLSKPQLGYPFIQPANDTTKIVYYGGDKTGW